MSCYYTHSATWTLCLASDVMNIIENNEWQPEAKLFLYSIRVLLSIHSSFVHIIYLNIHVKAFHIYSKLEQRSQHLDQEFKQYKKKKKPVKDNHHLVPSSGVENENRCTPKYRACCWNKYAENLEIKHHHLSYTTKCNKDLANFVTNKIPYP